MITILYQDRNITITEGFLRVTSMRDQVIPIGKVYAAATCKIKTGDYKPAAGLFILLTVISAFIFPILCVYFFPMAVAAYLTNQHKYQLMINLQGVDKILFESTHRKAVRRPVNIINNLVKRSEVILPEHNVHA